MKAPSHAEWNQRASAAANARRHLPRMMSKYFVEVRDALTQKQSPARLHPIRLASKKVRYTLELFRSCYRTAEFDARMEALKDVQTSLGEVNDAVAAWRLLRKMMPHSPHREALREFLKSRAAKKAEEFRKHWAEQFDAPGAANLVDGVFGRTGWNTSQKRCTVIRHAGAHRGKQGLEYFEGVSAQTAESKGLCMHVVTIPPLGRAKPHLHENHESAVYVLSGEAGMWYGEGCASMFGCRPATSLISRRMCRTCLITPARTWPVPG